MKKVQIHSAGIVPVYEGPEGPQVLLVEQQHGAEGTRWVFPKGKQESGEKLIDTAKREVKEETGLDITKVVEHKPFSVEFELTFNGAVADKIVTYFLGYVDVPTVKLCQNEVIDSEWFSFEEARERLTFDVDKDLFDRIISFYDEQKRNEK